MLCKSFHADLHAGNLMLLEDGRVGFIDFGIVGQLKPGSLDSLYCFYGCVAAYQLSGNGREYAKYGHD